MTREDIRAFMNRDWALVAAAKAATWEVCKRSPAGDLRAAHELRRHVQTAQPGWPSTDDRADDLRTHLRVSEALGAIAVRFR